ncbi:MAG TPA: hypothetical protein DEG17_00225 [Cyanobacteria bacterium UBA11149]|nr:hypothetical protein [Cyanobacteria bacterium UBA11367]HBE59651.1 hypothetical protein [Cyanobacteria bacterium UBA11366]HBK66164.1 hypothetical protein [Cyanobacteria bacterium UBA11166]HBR75834.1 hypothetical protein [Cyanobacteria bacterium UBA11159]HBS72561.1 hypothetical protein [Cyanobacteria bacterium UBA11153]HBW87347.1 hypothetical protein [Cyanobacteria bacterium UBA11149]HCA97567.1 hypothetical protein [Cyanobacteria bacterium UBA9226]
MNKQTYLSIIASLSLLNPITPPILAQTTPSNYQEQPTITQPIIKKNTRIIPQSTAIIITFPNNVQFDAGGKDSFPIILRLVEPILDHTGNIIAPANSRLNAAIVPSNKSAKIIANSLIVNGKVLPIKASSQTIPSVKVTVRSRMEQAQNYAQTFSRTGTATLIFDSETNSNDMIRSMIIAGGMGAIIGFLSPKSVDVANFTQNTEYILTLEEAVNIEEEEFSS